MLVKRIENRLKILGRKLIGKSFHNLRNDLRVTNCQNLDYGDYSSNFLFLLSKELKSEPEKVYLKIKTELEKLSYIKKTDIVNGYLNIFINEKLFFDDFKTVLLANNKFLENNLGKKDKVIIEYVSANPTGPLHIGNGRGAVLGDILCNILKLSGFKVTKEYYVNDRGNQIDLLTKTILYYLGKENYSENFYQGNYLKEFVDQYRKELLNFDYEKLKIFTIKYILDKLIKKTLKKFGTFFDNFYFETELYQKHLDKKILKIFKEKELLYEKDGALWLNLTKYGEEKDEVLIKQNGEQTYFFSDILYNYDKFFIRNYDYSYIILGSDHHDHIRRLKKTFQYVFNIEPRRFKFIEYQMVHLVKGGQPFKMSKRKGEFVSLNDLIDEVGTEPIRFYFAKYSPEMTINFDIDLVKKETVNNQIWYLMYTYARLNSILEKAKKRKIMFDYRKNIKTNLGSSFIYLVNQESFLRIFRRIHQFPLVIYEAVVNLKPNLIINYLLKLADELNNFYEKEIIISGEAKEIKYKIIFVYYLKKILELGFDLINIKPKERLYQPRSQKS